MNHPSIRSLARRFGLTSSICVTLIPCLLTEGRTVEPASPAYDWIPPEAMSEGLRAEESVQIIPEITITKTPKATADASKFTREFLIDLAKFGIFSDGTHAVETSKGLNAALQQAKAEGANRIVFPKGVYLINEADPIVLDHKNTIVDLNGATLQIQANGMPNYSVVDIVHGAENLRLTNGTIVGDRYTHDYKTKPGTHEWGTCINFSGGIHLEVDHLLLMQAAGDGASTGAYGSRTRPELLARIMHDVELRDLEPGAFNEQGEKVASTKMVRTIEPYDMTRCKGEFELGYSGGYQGFPFIKSRVYQVYFLDADRKFLEKKQVLQFRKVTIPQGAKYAHFEFNQPEVSDVPAHAGAAKGSLLARISNFTPPQEVHLHHNVFSENRRLGLAFTGGQRWVIEENHFEKTGGTNPMCGVDFEDGAELMQDVVFRKNTFQDNKGGDLAVCAGTELLFEENVFQKNVITWGRPHNYTFRKNSFNGGIIEFVTRTGIASIYDNTYKNCKKLSVRFDTKAVADGLVREAGKSVSTPPLLLARETLENVASVEGTYINFKDSRFTDTKFLVGERTLMVRFEGCEFRNSSIEFSEKGPNVSFVLKNNKGELPETGPGVGRKKSAGAQ